MRRIDLGSKEEEEIRAATKDNHTDEPTTKLNNDLKVIICTPRSSRKRKAGED